MQCKNNGNGRGCCFARNGAGEAEAHLSKGDFKLSSTDWLEEVPGGIADNQIFEVRFKNTRKGFYANVNGLLLKEGDIVAVESSPGHDIGIVSLTGDLVARQMRRVGFRPEKSEFRKIYRKAKPYDIEKWEEAIALEHSTMIHARQIAEELGLNMKIGDVEYQGDKIKAIFYYIADDRVDFRELIKILADTFHIRIEMKQIGARQEAGRIGGIGICGRELCCSSWISSFVSVTTNSARVQEIPLNPQKLAGQCGKLKCCMNYEMDSYIDAKKEIPRINAPLETIDGQYFLSKTDIHKRLMWFSTDPHMPVSLTALSIERVRAILAKNRKGIKVDRLVDEKEMAAEPAEAGFINVVGEESITRFDQPDRKRGGRNNRGRGNRRGDNSQGEKNTKPEGRDNTPRPQGERGPRPERRNGGNNPQGERGPRPEKRTGEGRAPQEKPAQEKRSGTQGNRRPPHHRKPNSGGKDGK